MVLLSGYRGEYPHHRLLASQHQDTLSLWTVDAYDRKEGHERGELYRPSGICLSQTGTISVLSRNINFGLQSF